VFRTSKYYDVAEGRLLVPEDGCEYDRWREGDADAKFAFHDEGFLVFLPSSEIAASDEYSEGDPYDVSGAMAQSSAFHKRRISCAIKMMERALGDASCVSRILDVGCGQGEVAAEVKGEFPEAEISGLDYSISAIRAATARHTDIDFVVASAYDLPYPPGYFDVVLCANIWEHVPDPLLLLKAVGRVLKPNGHVIISTPSRYRFRNLRRALRGKPVELISKHHVTEYTVGQVIEQLRFGGFDCEVYSEPLERSSRRSLTELVVIPACRFVLRMLKSHHSLEETVFYLGKKVE
jgi:ubiquinone/menaquinone biosynthesis C-methylase UbiE